MLPGTLLLLVAAAATAADPAPQSTPIDNITVEAAKLPTAITDLAANITLIDAERINRELAQDIDDLVRYEPGIDVVDQGSRFGLSDISIRGIGGNRVKIEVDGVSTSDAFSIGSFSNASRDFVDVDSLKQVEIIRGPASAVFGSDALGGVVSFVTKGPEDFLKSETGYLDLSVGVNSVDDSGIARTTAAMRLGNVAAMLRTNIRQGQERDVVGADPLDDDSVNTLGKFVVGSAGNGGLEIALEYFEADSVTDVDSLENIQDFSAAFGFPYVIDTTVVTGDDQRQRSRFSLSQEWIEGRIGIDYLRWRAYRQDSNTTQNTFEVRDTSINGVSSAAQREQRFEFDQELTGFEINAASDVTFEHVSHQLAYGLEYEKAETKQIRDGTQTNLLTNVRSKQVGPDLFPVRDFPRSKTTRVGVYVQNRLSIGRLSLLPGFRWDRYALTPEPDDIFAAGNPGINPVKLDEDRVSPQARCAVAIQR